MANEVAKFDPNAYVEAIRTRIKDALVGMIPDEQWDAMLRQQIDAFMTSKSVSDYHGSRRVPSELEKIVNDLMTEEVKAHVKRLLMSPEWQPVWTGVGHKVSEEVGKIAAEHGAGIINAWLAQAVQSFVNAIAHQISLHR